MLYGILDTGEHVGFALIEGTLVKVLILNSAHYGAAQRRKRVYFIIAVTTNHAILDS